MGQDVDWGSYMWKNKPATTPVSGAVPALHIPLQRGLHLISVLREAGEGSWFPLQEGNLSSPGSAPLCDHITLLPPSFSLVPLPVPRVRFGTGLFLLLDFHTHNFCI